MKKKYSVTDIDKKDWITFTKQTKHVYDKDNGLIQQNIIKKKIKKLDLHGFSLGEANKKVKEFIIQSYENHCKQLLIITGKGTRSKIHMNPYRSEELGVLKYSVPEFIKNDQDLLSKIEKISNASLKDGGDGAFYIFLKQQKKLKNKFR